MYYVKNLGSRLVVEKAFVDTYANLFSADLIENFRKV